MLSKQDQAQMNDSRLSSEASSTTENDEWVTEMSLFFWS